MIHGTPGRMTESKGRGSALEIYLEQSSYSNLLHVFCIPSLSQWTISHIPWSCGICFLWEWRQDKILTYEAVCYNCLRFVWLWKKVGMHSTDCPWLLFFHSSFQWGIFYFQFTMSIHIPGPAPDWDSCV